MFRQTQNVKQVAEPCWSMLNHVERSMDKFLATSMVMIMASGWQSIFCPFAMAETRWIGRALFCKAPMLVSHDGVPSPAISPSAGRRYVFGRGLLYKSQKKCWLKMSYIHLKKGDPKVKFFAVLHDPISNELLSACKKECHGWSLAPHFIENTTITQALLHAPTTG